MHLDDGQIQRCLHGELDAVATRAVERHLAECAECRRRLAEAEREEQQIFELLRRADHATPDIDAEELAARARGRCGGGWFWGWDVRLRWAAGILLVLGAAGIAYTAPGSPVAAWVNHVVGWIAGSPSDAPSDAPAPPSLPDAASAGIAVAPGQRYTIHFTAVQPAGSAVVSLTEGADITVRAMNEAVTFTTGVDRLTIANRGAQADYEIELPQDAPWVEIRVAGERLLLKQSDRVITDVPADARGRYVVPLSASGR